MAWNDFLKRNREPLDGSDTEGVSPISADLSANESIRKKQRMLLAGVAVASFLAAAQTLVQQQNTDDLREVYGWLLGQLGRAQWSDVVLVLPYAYRAIAGDGK